MYQLDVGEAASVSGGGDVVTDIIQAFNTGYEIGTAIDSAVDAVGGWGSYFEQVGSALGSME